MRTSVVCALAMLALTLAPLARADLVAIVTARDSDLVIVSEGTWWTSDVSNTFPAAPAGTSYYTIPIANYTNSITTTCAALVPTLKVSLSSPSPYSVLRSPAEIAADCAAQPPPSSSNAAPGSFERLVVKNDDTYPNDRIVITCDNITLSDQNTTFLNYKNVSVTLVMTQTAGTINGPDGAIDNPSTFISGFLVGKTDGTIGGELSASLSNLTGPTTLTSGYTLWKQVTVYRNDGSSNFVKQYQSGRRYKLDANASTLVSGGTGTSSTDVDATAVFSSFTKMTKLLVVTGLNTCDMTINPFTTATFAYQRTSGLNMIGECDLPLSSDRHFRYKLDSGSVTIYGIGGDFGL